MAITNNNNSVVTKNQVLVDADPVGNWFKRTWNSKNPAAIGLGAIAAGIVFPGFATTIGAITLPILAAHALSHDRYPLRAPKSSRNRKDPNDIIPGEETELSDPRAITCLGMDVATQRQVWENSDRDRQHHIILATTGSGKTYGLRFHLAMSLTQTSGVIAIDGKGDIGLPLDSVSLIRRYARDDDIRILRFTQGNKNIYAETGIPITNTFNPISTGSSTYISEVLKALLSDDDPSAGKGDMWQKRAEAMCDNIAKMATYKRDHGDFKIRPGTIAKMLNLRELCRIYVDPDIPEEYKSTLALYFDTLPDFDVEQAPKYAEGAEFKGKILEQHGYVAMQLQPALTVLSDKYGPIFDTDNPEIDLKDVVINNRFLLVLLPAMEQSEGTTRNTGKIILAALKGMIAGELGSQYQGNIDELLSERACTDAAPFKTFLDECGYYAAIRGIEILPAQGRGLGFAFYFIGQSYTDLEKGGKEVAEIIWANCNNKTAGKSESDVTYKKFAERLDEVEVLVRDRQEIHYDSFGNAVKTNANSLSITKKKRLEMADMVRLREGQYFHINGSDFLEVRTGDPDIPKKDRVKEVRYNQLVGLPPVPEAIQARLRNDYSKGIAFMKKNVESGNPRGINLNKFKGMRGIITSFRERSGTGDLLNSDPVIAWERVLFDIVTEEESEKNKQSENEISKILAGRKNTTTPAKADTTESKPEKEPPAAAVEETASSTQDNAGTTEPSGLTGIQTTNWAALALNSTEASQTTASDNDNDDDGYLDSHNPYASDDAADNSSDYQAVQSADFVGDDDDGFGTAEQDLEEVDELQTEIRYLDYLLETGQLSSDEYDAHVEELKLEFAKRDGDWQDDDGLPSYEAINAPEQDPFNAIGLDQTPKQEMSAPPQPLTSSEDGNNYPSEEAKELRTKLNKQDAKTIIDDVSSAFDLSGF